MASGPHYSYALVQQYVQGNGEALFAQFYKTMYLFLKVNVEPMEEAYQKLEVIRKLSIFDVNREQVEDSVTTGYRSVTEAVQSYMRVHQVVENQLRFIREGFGAKGFLRMNGVPPEQVGWFLEEVQWAWEATYGLHIERVEKVLPLLAELRKVLQAEIHLLGEIPGNKFYNGVQANAESYQLFLRERDLFWEIASTLAITADEVKRLVRVVQIAAKRVRIEKKALVAALRSQVNEEYEAAQGRLQKTIVVLVFAIGGALLLLNLKALTVQETGRFGLHLIQEKLPTLRLKKATALGGRAVEDIESFLVNLPLGLAGA